MAMETMPRSWLVRCAAFLILLCSLLSYGVSAEEEDPFADLAQLLLSDSTRLRKDRDAKRKALKEADAQLKAARREVEEYERRLQDAREALHRNETAHKEAKEAKEAAEKAVMRGLTDIVSEITDRAEGKLGELRGEKPSEKPRKPGRGREEPVAGAEVVLWDERRFKGQKLKIQCCGHIDLAERMREEKFRGVRSVQVPRGLRARFVASLGYGNDGASPIRFESYGALAEMDGIITDYRQSCCDSIWISSGVEHHDDTSVILYEEEGFEGKSFAFLEGDFEGPKLKQVGSVRVPAGFTVMLRSSTSEDADSWGSLLGILKHDTRTFPVKDTSMIQNPQPKLPVKSITIRRTPPEDLHGLFVYFEPSFQGRSQFFESGEHYLYPEAWPAIRSVRPTNWTYSRLFSVKGLQRVEAEVAEYDEEARPFSVEVASRCEPEDFCGEHGTCVKPQQCSCSGSYQGERCHLQVPDETSAILCNHNIIAVGEVLPCRVELRRDSIPCNATSVFLRLDPSEATQGVVELFDCPLVKMGTGGWSRMAAREDDTFPFDAVFNKTIDTGLWESAESFVFSVFGKPAVGAFAPQLEVLPRCDEAGTVAAARCQESIGGDRGLNCSLTLHNAAGKALRCPARSLQLHHLHTDGRVETVVVQAEGRQEAGKQFGFSLKIHEAPRLRHGKALPPRLRLEVHHGVLADLEAQQLEVRVEIAAVTGGAAPALASELQRAQALLRSGNAVGALEALAACADLRACTRLRADLLMQMGRFEEAEGTLPPAAAKECAMAKHAQKSGQDALSRGDSAEAIKHFKLALVGAPLSVSLHLLLADASLLVGEFDQAVEESRLAHRLNDYGAAASTAKVSPTRVLKTFGTALLAIGLGDVAIQNFNGCRRLAEELGSEDVCALDLAKSVKELQKDATRLDEVVRNEIWTTMLQQADSMLTMHYAILPHFGKSYWGLKASAARCLALSALNNTEPEEILRPCDAVVGATSAMRLRLPPLDIIKCYMVLALMLERQGQLDTALARAEEAVVLVRQSDADGLESVSAEVHVLHERIGRAMRKERARTDVGNQTNNDTKKVNHTKPADHYAALGLAKNASQSEIKSAYRKLALKYHPDKNKDPEAIPIFLDIQQAYEVLSSEDLRRRYDAGQNVDDEAGQRNMKPMKYKIVEIDRKRGIAKVWWYDPNTGEEGFMEQPIEKEGDEGGGSGAQRKRTLRDHCCLPDPDVDEHSSDQL